MIMKKISCYSSWRDRVIIVHGTTDDFVRHDAGGARGGQHQASQTHSSTSERANKHTTATGIWCLLLKLCVKYLLRTQQENRYGPSSTGTSSARCLVGLRVGVKCGGRHVNMPARERPNPPFWFFPSQTLSCTGLTALLWDFLGANSGEVPFVLHMGCAG